MLDTADKCPLIASGDHTDTDSDGSGHACDTDDDGDGVLDEADKCPLEHNQDQADDDKDRIGNACDTDTNGDGILDTATTGGYLAYNSTSKEIVYNNATATFADIALTNATTAASAGAAGNFLRIVINGTPYKIQLYADA